MQSSQIDAAARNATAEVIEIALETRPELTLDEQPFVNLRDPARRWAPMAGRLSAGARRCGRTCPTSKWNDWRWQLSHRVNDLEEIEQILNLTDEEREGLRAPDKFRVDITPYFISLIDPDDPDDPIRRQVIPLGREQRPSPR